VALASVTLYRTVHLGGYDALKNEIVAYRETQSGDAHASLTTLDRFLAAPSVSTLASLIHYPLDSVRRRMMMQSNVAVGRYHSARHCFQQIYVHEGWRGYYLGIEPNLIRSFGAAVLLVSYDFFKSLL
jgi:solute carrier family 25 (adenine nucleotide translocator) protein 4/5/6/31